MRVIVAKSAGFCWGVKRAVEKARRLLQEGPAPVYTDGPLIHNEQMLDELRAEGIRETRNPAALRRGTLLIRAHGIPPERRAMLRRLGLRLADATCRDVGRIQGMIRRYAQQGYHTIIFGDRGHAEVLGLLGCAQGRGCVVTDPAEVASLPDMDRVCAVAQSTQFPEHYRQIAEAVGQRFPGAVILDTICEATRNRQSDLVKLARRVDAIVVVGGQQSANTQRLVELARSLKPTFFIQKSSQLRARDFRALRVVGLTAGASTPDFVIAEVRQKLAGFGPGIRATLR